MGPSPNADDLGDREIPAWAFVALASYRLGLTAQAAEAMGATEALMQEETEDPDGEIRDLVAEASAVVSRAP